MSSSSSSTTPSSLSTTEAIKAALDARSYRAKEVNELIRKSGLDFFFAKKEVTKTMDNELTKDVLAEDYVPNTLDSLKVKLMTKVTASLQGANHRAAMITKAWSDDDGKARTYDLLEVFYQNTDERFIAEIDFCDEISKTIDISEDVKDQLPLTFVGNDDDLLRLTSAITEEEEEPDDAGRLRLRLAKWLGPRLGPNGNVN